MDVGVELTGVAELRSQLDHAHAQLLDLTDNLEHQLDATTPPMRVFASPAMTPRTWGTGDVWRLPAGGWVADTHGRVDLPDPADTLTTYAQQLLG